jgi:2-iminobutanoate/2-iminopropanoate deaminase
VKRGSCHAQESLSRHAEPSRQGCDHAFQDGALAGTGIEEQTRITLGNLAAVLESAGASLADVVRCGVFLADVRDFAAMDKVYAGAFPRPLPARTTVGATFPLPGMLVEIDCVAVLPRTGLAGTGGGQPTG